MVVKRIAYLIFYAFSLAYNILKSALVVMLLCLSGKIDPQVMEVGTCLKKPIAYLFLANSITLTPGTVTIAIDLKNQTLKVASIVPRRQEDIIPFEKYIRGVFE